MTYVLKITRDGEPVIETEISADEVIDALLRTYPPLEQPEEPEEAPAPKRTGRKKGKRKPAPGASAELTGEINGHYQRRQHPETERIEQLLLEGMSVPAVLEKVEVSAPTVYVIKTRLKKEGRLTE